MVYLGFACAIVGVAAVLAAARGGDAGWAIGVLAVLFVVMVGHDAYSRGLSPLWGLFALSLLGLFLYVRKVRDGGPTLRP